MKKSYKRVLKSKMYINSIVFYLMFAVGMSPSLNRDFDKENDEIIVDDNSLFENHEHEIELMSADELNELFKACIKEPEPEVTYSGMKLSNEYENQVKELCELYNVPSELILTIGYQESDGKWDNNGKISPTDDYGEFQINECNHDYIKEQLGYTSDDLLYDPIKNAEAAILLVSDIIKMDSSLSAEEIFGIYNGWTNWREKDTSIRYSNSCFRILCEYFSGFEYGEKMYVKVHR